MVLDFIKRFRRSSLVQEAIETTEADFLEHVEILKSNTITRNLAEYLEIPRRRNSVLTEAEISNRISALKHSVKSAHAGVKVLKSILESRYLFEVLKTDPTCEQRKIQLIELLDRKDEHLIDATRMLEEYKQRKQLPEQLPDVATAESKASSASQEVKLWKVAAMKFYSSDKKGFLDRLEQEPLTVIEDI